MQPVIKIDGRSIGAEFTPYMIAELSANHNGSIETALAMIDAAKAAGADAIKIQTYTADTITLDCDRPDFQISEGLWKGRSLYELYDWAHTPWDWHKQLFDHARSRGITMFSSPFDRTAVELLEDLNAPAYKIASFEAVDLPLIRYVASTGKPMIISTGMANLEEIKEAYEAARSGGCKELAILHCVSGYPAPADDYNLRTIADLAEKFDAVVGLSDHTLGNTTAVVSVGLGSSIVEKHFILDRSHGGPDSVFSMEPSELKSLCTDLKTAWESIGSVNYARKESEKANMKFRRSLYVVAPVRAGEQLSTENVRSIRPGYGMPPKELDNVLGAVASRDLERGEPLTADCFSAERR